MTQPIRVQLAKVATKRTKATIPAMIVDIKLSSVGDCIGGEVESVASGISVGIEVSVEYGAIVDTWTMVCSLVGVGCMGSDEMDPPTLDGEGLVAIDRLGVTECESEIRMVDEAFEES